MFPAMSTHRKGTKWVVRWREDGRQRSLTFDTRKDATAFNRALADAKVQARQARAVAEALDRARS